MPNYRVKVSSAPKGHVLPDLLKDVGAWLKKQEHGSLGWFDGMALETIPKEWDEQNAVRLQKSAYSFLSLGEGSMLCLMQTGAKSPPAVVLLGSEGDRGTVADSLEEFLVLWSKGETEVSDLDDDDGAPGRARLASWLEEKKVKAPKARSFDFQAWLDEGEGGVTKVAPAPPKAIKRKPTAWMKKLGPKGQKLASLLGMRVDAPEVVSYVTKDLGKKLPESTSERKDGAGLEAPKAGVQLSVTHEVRNDAYPPIHKTAKSFIPYVSHVWLDAKFGEAFLGVPWNVANEADVIKALGTPMSWRGIIVTDKKKTAPVWTYTLDEGAQVELEISYRNRLRVELSLRSASELEKYDRVTTGIFMAWAATKGLLDASALAPHADLVAALSERKAKGTDLWDALGRGFWDTHLADDEELRSFAYLWFHNLGGQWIKADLKEVFGKRTGPHGHDEPKVDDASWDAVDKASKVFTERFKPWLKRP
jgi:hypothetical protein